MATNNKVWIVEGTAGSYDDQYTFVVNAFTDEQSALDEAFRLNEHVGAVNAALKSEYEDAGFRYLGDDSSYEVGELSLDEASTVSTDADIARGRERLAGMIAARETNPRLRAAYEERKNHLQDHQ